MGSNVVSEIKANEKRIRKLQQDKARIEGQKSQLMDRLKSEFELGTVEEAVSEIERLYGKKDNVEKRLFKINSEMEAIISGAEERDTSSCESNSQS